MRGGTKGIAAYLAMLLVSCAVLYGVARLGVGADAPAQHGCGVTGTAQVTNLESVHLARYDALLRLRSTCC